jgi:hypothetical protein
MWLILPVSALAQELGPDLEVRASGDARQVRVDFRTVEDQSQVCPLRVNRLLVDAPPVTDAGLAAGVIDFQVAADPTAPCLAVVGQQTGSIRFSQGRELPALAHGRYDLVINDTSYGVLVVHRDGARLTEAE